MQTLKAAVSLTDQQSQPVNDEAKRVLKFFMSTLLNSNMPRPADFDSMRSLTTLVPHYAEDVIYALDADEVEARTGKKVRRLLVEPYASPTSVCRHHHDNHNLQKLSVQQDFHIVHTRFFVVSDAGKARN